MRFFWRTLVLVLALATTQASAQSVSLLPNAESQFTDGNGAPYVGGNVYMYVPGTTTPKSTWQDSAQTTLNSNPIVLDSSGRALIWGSGCYRQVLQDQYVNTIWDQITCAGQNGSLASSGLAWAGLAGGGANALTLTTIGSYSQVDGAQVGFMPSATNTSATTINVDGSGTLALYKDGISGPVALGGGELQFNGSNGNIYWATYSSRLNAYLLTGFIPLPGYPIIASNYGMSPTSPDNTAAFKAFWQACQQLNGFTFGGKFTGGNRCVIPGGHYLFTQSVLLDTSFNQGGGWKIECSGQNATVLDWSGTPNTGLTIASSIAEGWFYGIIENCGFYANTENATVQIGQPSLLDASNGLNLTSDWIVNTSGLAGSAALLINNGADDLLLDDVADGICTSSNSGGWCNVNTNGDALRMVNAGFTSVIGGSYSSAATSVHLAVGYDFSNTFTAIDCEVVYNCIVFDSPNGGANTWLNGQYVNNPSGFAAVDNSSETYAGQVLENPNFSSFPWNGGTGITNFTLHSPRYTDITTPAYPSSTVPVFNRTGRKILVNTEGGSVSLICWGPYTATCPGTCVCQSFSTASTQYSTMLNPGDQIVETYTGSPAWAWNVLQ